MANVSKEWDSREALGGRVPKYMSKKSLVWNGLAAASIAFILVAFTPLAYYYGRPLLVESEPARSDAIVLFSSGQLNKTWLSLDAAQRTMGAIRLYRLGFAPLILSSGSNPRIGLHQAELQAEWLKLAGVPADAIEIDNQSARTYESCVLVARMMQQRHWNSVVIVTSQLDVPRIRLVFNKLNITASYYAVPEYAPPRDFFSLWSFPFAHHATYEYAAILFYKFKGWI